MVSSTFYADLKRISRDLERLVRGADPGSVSGDEARSAVALFSEIERTASSGVALYAPVVVETGSYAKLGHGTAAEWLGSVSGSSAGAAKGRLSAARCAARDPLLTRALLGGELSTDQLNLVAKTAAEVPEATGDLVDLVEKGASHQELKDAATRLRAAKRCRESERARRARIHANRHFRWHQDDGGGIRGEFLCDEVQWARVCPMLEAEAKERWKQAGAKDGGSLEAHRLDAFVHRLAGSAGSNRSGGGIRSETLILIDARALRRGTTQGDEVCEIEGVGPVSVEAATELLGEGGVRFLVKEGFDLKTVTRSTRHVSKCIDAALIARDRTCAVPHCGKRLGLERDHREIDFRDNGPTELDNLVRLCPEHHQLKTHGGFRLEGAPGRWKWMAPEHPKSAGYIARASRLAATKARADRNSPQRN